MFTPFLPYWRNESSGKLALAVERFFNFATAKDTNTLTDSEIALLKAYLKFWVDYPWQGLGGELDYLRTQFDRASTYEQLRDCIDLMLDLCIDPF